MAFSLIVISIIALTIMTYVDCRPRNFDRLKTLNAGKSEDWKVDGDFIHTWKGAFTLGAPDHSECPMVMQPENGRFVCSVGTLLERSMCLAECKIGFEQEKPPVVYLCENGKWKDLQNNLIKTPEPVCVPKPVQMSEFAE